MAQKDKEQDEVKDEKVKIRHTITAEETFTLAKDVFDIRCFIKNVYNNRAVIARRLNFLTLTTSFILTLLYAAYVLFTGFTKKVTFQAQIALYVVLGVYAVLLVALVIVVICCDRAKTKNVPKIKKTLKIFKILVRITSVALSIIALVFSRGETASDILAVDVLIIVFSIISLIIQIIPLLCGGFARLSRWLMSPVKIKYRFAKVVNEWFELAVSGNGAGAVKKVSDKYYDEISSRLDNYLVPALGKKYVNAIKATQLVAVVNRADEADRPVLEGILKNVFEYATECGYVVFNPCKDLNFQGTVEEEEKEKPTVKKKLFNLGRKIGKNVLDKYIQSTVSDDTDK